MPAKRSIILTCEQCGNPFSVVPSRRKPFCSRACYEASRAPAPDGAISASDIERFWRHVDTSNGADACWEWQGAKMKGGYGNFGVGGRDGRYYGAHVFSFLIHHGPVPDGKEVCHTCDNRPCVNPAHLYPGTHKQNMEDAVERGRTWHPPSVPSGPRLRPRKGIKLTPSDVRSIRQSLEAQTSTQSALAREYGVSAAVISNIARHKIWQYID